MANNASLVKIIASVNPIMDAMNRFVAIIKYFMKINAIHCLLGAKKAIT